MRFNDLQNITDAVYKEVFVRKVNDEENAEKATNPAINKPTTRKVENEKATKLPRRIIKPTPKEISCPSLYKIPEEITVNKKYTFVAQNEVMYSQIVDKKTSTPLSAQGWISRTNQLKK